MDQEYKNSSLLENNKYRRDAGTSVASEVSEVGGKSGGRQANEAQFCNQERRAREARASNCGADRWQMRGRRRYLEYLTRRRCSSELQMSSFAEASGWTFLL